MRILTSQAYVSLAHKDACPYALRIRMLRVKQHAFKAVCKQIKLYEKLFLVDNQVFMLFAQNFVVFDQKHRWLKTINSQSVENKQYRKNRTIFRMIAQEERFYIAYMQLFV